MNTYQDTLALVGRILLAGLFVLSGYNKFVGFDGTVGYIAAGGLPLPTVVAVLTILLELVGGLMLVVGLLTRPVALAIAVFTLLAAFLFHAYWSVPDADRMSQYLSFWKNISIAGGMLVLAAFGPGALSLDARRRA